MVDRELCHCMGVTEREVRLAIRAGARSVDEVGEQCEAGTGCGSCRGGIQLLLQQEERRASRRPIPDAIVQQLALFETRIRRGLGRR